MCGIAGCFLRKGYPSRERLLAAARKLAHRGPDGEGIFLAERVGFAHRRLAIIDLKDGLQPLTEPQEELTIVFNGEIYNYRELRHQLEAQGENFRTRSDTEVLAVLLRREGVACLEKLRGMFAFAAYFHSGKALLLARDWVGKKPLFYTETPEGFFFASELPALIALLGKTPPLSLKALELFLALRYVPQPWTIFSGVKRLLPAEYLLVKEGSVREKGPWCTFTPLELGSSFEEAREALREAFDEAVKYRLVADVPVGAFLSGGIDSSLVVASMAEQKGRVHTFSVGFEDDPASELPYARKIAHLFDTHHEEVVLSAESLFRLPEVITRFGEPFANETALLCYLLAEEASRRVKVVLTGDGGDEVFAGYRRYLKFFKRAWWQWRGKERGPEDYFAQLCLFEKRERVALLGRAYGWPEALIKAYWKISPRREPLSQMQFVDLKTYLPGDILFYADHTTMSFGLEARAPFLDRKVASLGLGLPSDYKLRAGKTKFILRKLFPERIPEKFFDRKKRGFSPPLKRWLKGPLGGKVRELIREAPPFFYEILNKKAVENLLRTKLTGEVAKKLFALYVLAHFLNISGVSDAREEHSA